MLTSFGFDTIAIHVNRYNSNFIETINFFYSLGIKNFLLIFDYDPLQDSLSIIKSRMNEFKKLYKPSVRGKLKCAVNLHISPGSGFNDTVDQIYCNKRSRALLSTLPLFPDKNYDQISHDINNLLYKKSTSLFFASFDKTVESSSLEFCSKFINNPRISLTVDINYLFNPQKQPFFNNILTHSCPVIPSISQDISYYVGIAEYINFAIENYGKKDYFRLCSQINKASDKIFN